MSVIDREIREYWEMLRGKRPHYDNFLEAITIRNMRGIGDLRVPFSYPVTALAGANACGKSTVLFGCAAAYDNAAYTPAKLFPSYLKEDAMQGAEIEYQYVESEKDEGRKSMAMKWKLGKQWNRNFLGRKAGRQPQRNVYLRTLAMLTSPSEVRSILQIKQGDHDIKEVPYELLLLSRNVLQFEYESVRMAEKSTGKKQNLLLATLAQKRGAYSEFHMAAGERAILRLSMELAQLNDALVLIDEVEADLHPHLQKLLMLNLQSVALRQNLQIIVTTHSPVVLDSVPSDGRVFLERDRKTHNVSIIPSLRDVVQKVMYGQVDDKLTIICEDSFAESLILGVMDALSREIGFTPNQIHIGRDTGKDAFPNHVRTLALVDKLEDTVFVLDGDGQTIKGDMQKVAPTITALFLPGECSPEEWLWGEIKQYSNECEEWLSIPELSERMTEIERTLASSSSKERYKVFFGDFAEIARRTPEQVARTVVRHLSESRRGGIADFLSSLESEIKNWRKRN